MFSSRNSRCLILEIIRLPPKITLPATMPTLFSLPFVDIIFIVYINGTNASKELKLFKDNFLKLASGIHIGGPTLLFADEYRL